MSRRNTVAFYAGMSLCLLIGTLEAITELCIGTRLDSLAEWLARR